MNRLIVWLGALALLVSASAAMAGPTGEAAGGAADGAQADDIMPPPDATPAETEMPTADTDAAEEKADDRLPEERKIDQFGDSIDDGHEGG